MKNTPWRLCAVSAFLLVTGCAGVVIQYRRDGPSRKDYLTESVEAPLSALQLDLWRTDSQPEITIGAQPFTRALLEANARNQGSRSGWSAQEVQAQIQRWMPVLVDSSTCFYVKFNGARFDSGAPGYWRPTVIDADKKEHPGTMVLSSKDERFKYPKLYGGALSTVMSFTTSTYTNNAIACADKVDLGRPFQLRLDPRSTKDFWPFLLSWDVAADEKKRALAP